MDDHDFRLTKCTKTDDEQLVDRISQLPREILVSILSFLTLEDAARTSVLSKRWTDIWMFVSRLNFDTSKLWKGLRVKRISEYRRLRKSKRSEYVKWVNKVLQSHKATALDEFRICFDLGKSSQDDIDRWLQFALTRRVKRLDLNLSDYGGCNSPGGSDSCVFPHDLFGLGNGNSSAVAGYCGSGINSQALFGFKTLRALTFKNVIVSGEVLESLLHNCPFLEYLVVVGSVHLNKFEVCGPTLALKHLEIIYCPKLRLLTICNTNIVSLKITSGGDRLVLRNVPMLVDVYVGGPPSKTLVWDAISWLSCCWSKLEFLTLRVLSIHVGWEEDNDDALPQLTKLKQLTLNVHAYLDDSLIAFTSLARASPNLEKFVLKLNWLNNIERTGRESKKAPTSPLEHLKFVELYGYYGRTTEVELVEYFLENAAALERIIVDPRDVPPLFGFPREDPAEEEEVRKLARQQLQGLVPLDVELVIL